MFLVNFGRVFNECTFLYIENFDDRYCCELGHLACIVWIMPEMGVFGKILKNNWRFVSEIGIFAWISILSIILW